MTLKTQFTYMNILTETRKLLKTHQALVSPLFNIYDPLPQVAKLIDDTKIIGLVRKFI